MPAVVTQYRYIVMVIIHVQLLIVLVRDRIYALVINKVVVVDIKT